MGEGRDEERIMETQGLPDAKHQLKYQPPCPPLHQGLVVERERSSGAGRLGGTYGYGHASVASTAGTIVVARLQLTAPGAENTFDRLLTGNMFRNRARRSIHRNSLRRDVRCSRPCNPTAIQLPGSGDTLPCTYAVLSTDTEGRPQALP